MRLSWDDVWLATSLVIGARSRCDRSHAGCVLVTADNQVVAVAYNGPPAGLQVEGPCSGWCPRAETGGGLSYDDCVAVHAEQNAVAMADRTRLTGGTAYVTRVPCFTCAKILANSGIVRIVYRPDRPDDVNREPDRSLKQLSAAGVLCVPMTMGDIDVDALVVR